jgi:tRNA U34 5-methylaminomethyl-2-thiouridine-forming methyltransferase MnmC
LLKELVVTADGSSSIYIPELNEHYHSVHGAIQEAKHVFIEAGLKFIQSSFKKVRLLEIGFGTGLNCFLTFLESINLNTQINYTAIEPFPLTKDFISKLNYVEQLNTSQFVSVYNAIHGSGDAVNLSEQFLLKKIYKKIHEVELAEKYNLVYFDAFGPRVQPEMWTAEVFEKIYNAMDENGALVTYCAKGEVKRTLKSIGFTVETLKGPPGKREMVRAVKD